MTGYEEVELGCEDVTAGSAEVATECEDVKPTFGDVAPAREGGCECNVALCGTAAE